MNYLKIGLILTAAALFAAACGQNAVVNQNTVAVINQNTVAAPPVAVDELAAAHKNYTELCIKCHKEGGIGGISDIDGKRIKAPNLTSERMKKDDDADWIDSITNGIADEGMPAFKDKLNDGEIKDLVKLIRRDFQGK